MLDTTKTAQPANEINTGLLLLPNKVSIQLKKELNALNTYIIQT